jgi:tetratricopeptide (TPR) repeat protein
MEVKSQQKETLPINAATLLLLAIILIPLLFSVYESMTSSQQETKPADAVSPQLSASTKAEADKLISEGMTFYQQGLYDSCIVINKKVLAIDPRNDIAWNNIAASYGAIGKYAEEIEACNQALAINPNNQLAKNNKSWAESQMKNQ